MKEFPRYKLFLPEYSAVNYDTASDIIISKAEKNTSYGVSALAVHGLVTSILDDHLGKVINKIQMIVPDGQPVRWALNKFYNLNLKDRVYGPELTLHVLRKADSKKLGIYLYGSKKETLDKFTIFISKYFPGIKICGTHPDRFRESTYEEDNSDIRKINNSGTNLVLVGRGCPRQEFWVANHIGKINAVMMAVGAAFDFHAGILSQAPPWMQKNGLEWLFRLTKEPKRLWKRYLITNSVFIFLYFKHKFILKNPF